MSAPQPRGTRSLLLTLWVTPAEKAAMQALAKAVGASVSELIRAAVLTPPPVTAKSRKVRI